MKNLTYFLLLIPVFVYSQSGWFQQTSNYNGEINSVYFINSQTGWAVGGYNFYTGTILKTTNGGTNWFVQKDSISSKLLSISFINENTGYLAGRSILKTTNSGHDWNYCFGQPFFEFNSVFFSSEMIGYAVGDSVFDIGKAFKTTNAGQSWFKLGLNSSFYQSFISCFFVDDNTGWIIRGNYSEIVYKTTNGGLNWSGHYTLIQPNAIYFINSLTGWGVGDALDSAIVKTTNGGNSWIKQKCSDVNNLSSLYFVSDNTGWAAGSGNVIKTTNGGINWYKQLIPSQGYWLNFIHFSSHDIGYVVGYNGTILKTTTGGDPIGIKPITQEIPDNYFLSQNYPNPFNPITNIRFDLPHAGLVTINIYDITGKLVETLLNKELTAGTYNVDWDAGKYSSGVYFYQLSAISGSNEFTQTKRMVLMK